MTRRSARGDDTVGRRPVTSPARSLRPVRSAASVATPGNGQGGAFSIGSSVAAAGEETWNSRTIGSNARERGWHGEVQPSKAEDASDDARAPSKGSADNLLEDGVEDDNQGRVTFQEIMQQAFESRDETEERGRQQGAVIRIADEWPEGAPGASTGRGTGRGAVRGARGRGRARRGNDSKEVRSARVDDPGAAGGAALGGEGWLERVRALETSDSGGTWGQTWAEVYGDGIGQRLVMAQQGVRGKGPGEEEAGRALLERLAGETEAEAGAGPLALEPARYRSMEMLQAPAGARVCVSGGAIDGRGGAGGWGQWRMLPGGRGALQGLRSEWEPPGEDGFSELWALEIWQSTMSVAGGPWLLDDCSVRCRGGSALHVTLRGGVAARRCSFGGGREERDHAGNGVVVKLQGVVTLHACFVLHTGFAAGVGVRAVHHGIARLRACRFFDNEYAVGVDGRGRIEAATCAMEQQGAAAVWVGDDWNETAVSLRGCRVKGAMFHDLLIEERNETAAELVRTGHMCQPRRGMVQSGEPGSLYTLAPACVVRPGLWAAEEVDESSLSLLVTDNDEFGRLAPEWERHWTDGLEQNWEQGGKLQEAADDSVEDDLYAAATLDVQREMDGAPPVLLPADEDSASSHDADVPPPAPPHVGFLAQSVARARRARILVPSEVVEGVKEVVRTQAHYNKWAEQQNAKKVPPDMRLSERPGVDVPAWWTPFRLENALKRELGFWGNQVTEWDSINRPLTDEDRFTFPSRPAPRLRVETDAVLPPMQGIHR